MSRKGLPGRYAASASCRLANPDDADRDRQGIRPNSDMPLRWGYHLGGPIRIGGVDGDTQRELPTVRFDCRPRLLKACCFLCSRIGLMLPFQVTDRLRERFLQKVNRGGECWEWVGGGRGVGYGSFKIEGKVYDAHRVSYMLHIGRIPDGMVVMHACDNRNCVNPSHLRIGTQKDNMEDCKKKGRLARQDSRGSAETKHAAKVALALKERGVSFCQSAKMLGVTKSSLMRALRWASNGMFGLKPKE